VVVAAVAAVSATVAVVIALELAVGVVAIFEPVAE